MYNSFRKGTEAHYLMADFIEVDQALDGAQESFQEVAERACGELDEALDQVDEVERERDELQEQLDAREHIAARRYLEILESVRDVVDRGIIQLRAEFNVAKESTDGSSGDRSDDSVKGDSNEGDGRPAT